MHTRLPVWERLSGCQGSLSSYEVPCRRLALLLPLATTMALLQALVGLPLRSFTDVFQEWTTRFGEDNRLLSGLLMRAMEGSDTVWRVGVHAPAGGSASRGTGASSLEVRP